MKLPPQPTLEADGHRRFIGWPLFIASVVAIALVTWFGLALGTGELWLRNGPPQVTLVNLSPSPSPVKATASPSRSPAVTATPAPPASPAPPPALPSQATQQLPPGPPSPSPTPTLTSVSVTLTWYPGVAECRMSPGSCAFAVSVQPFFSDGSNHGIGSVSGACGSVRVTGSQLNGSAVDDTYNGCTATPPPAWTGRSDALFAMVLQHAVHGAWHWTATFTYQGVTGTRSGACSEGGCPGQ